MKLKFKSQKYQTDAVEALVSCFEGQVKKQSRYDLVARYTKTTGDGFLKNEEEIEVVAYGNQNISLTTSDIRSNIRKVQTRNDINHTDKEDIKQFSIEMETGTGKTYTYIKSMYELNNHYGWNKFIIMVPSIAIREGVQKSLQITEEHFQELYKKKIRFFTYNSQNSSNIANINNFASDDSIQVMIINYQAFNAKSSANRRIYEELDELQSRRPIDVIKSVKPILIIDEPQKFGDKTEELFEEFNPLFITRYSATHLKNKEYNKVYRLDAVDAYNQKLVKKINVKGIEIVNQKSDSTFLFLDRIEVSKKSDPIAYLEIEVKSSTGTKKKLIKVNKNDDLYSKSGELTPYKGYVVSEIDARESFNKVSFTNGKEIHSGELIGTIDEEHIARIQIRETLKSHFEKEKNLFKSNIKVLSLFFIDEVSKYKYYEDSQALKGRYAQIFEEEYNYLLNENKNLLDVEYSKYLESFETGKIHAGYFSIDKKGNAINSKLDNKKEGLSFDEGAYDLIMKDKERLLSLSEPVRFIFSHSALREGWDNPNIFQICTLKHSESTISKRQEIGRGLRICVNGNGERMDYSKLESDFHSINNLTIIANESYDSFSKDLQKEISDSLTERPKSFDVTHFINKVLVNDSGNQVPIDSILFTKISMHCLTNDYIDKDTLKVTDNMIQAMNNDTLEVLPELEEFKDEYINLMKKLYLNNNTSLISNERKSTIKNLVPNDNFNKKEFQDLWNKINVKTIYEVDFDTAELISKSVDAINTKLNVTTTKVKITEGNQKDTFDSVSLKASESMKEVSSKIQSFDITSMSQIKYDLIGEIVKDTKLTRKTIIAILQKITENKFEMFKINPEEFIRRTSKLINEEKAATVINGITYHKTDQIYSNDIFTINNISGEVDKNAFDVKKHIYDFLITDSNIERKFAEKLETGEVTVYAKLPNGFKIPTPVGNYNPDWAIVFDNEDFKYVYFIAETKGTMDSLELRQTEKAKIECAKKHFECISNNSVKYDVVDSYKNLIDLLV